jgi:hypothetical protein
VQTGNSAIVTYAQANGAKFAMLRDVDFAQSAACGRCVEATVVGTSRMTVATVIGSCINGICGDASTGMALSPAAFADLTTGSVVSVTWRYVACPVTGNVYARVEPTGIRVVILNHAYGIVLVEMFDSNTTWIPLTRGTDNYWSPPSGFTVAGHMIRVTDINGAVVTGNVALANNDQMLGAQFPMCMPTP